MTTVFRSEAARAAVSRARVQLIERAPFFGVLALRLKLVEQSEADCPTMAVDGVSLFYSVAFVESVTEQELLGVVCHEALHCAYRHFARRGTRDPEQWNYAADYALNPAVIAAGFRLPDGCLIDPRFAGMCAETIFDLLTREGNKGRKPGDKPGNQPGEVRDAPKGTDPVELEGQWSDAVKTAIGVASKRAEKGRGIGSGFAGLDTFKSTVGISRVDWKHELSRFTDFSSYRDYDWTRPARRFAWQGVNLPSLVSVRPSCVVFMIDTSGSMDTACLADIHSEAQSALDAGSFDMLVIVYANTAVQKVETYYPGDTIADGPEHGTGGTSFAQPLDYVAAEYPDASALVYLTDGGTSDWGTDPGCPVLWALTIPAQYARSIVPPFGDSVPML